MECFSTGDQELLAVADRAGDVVWQATVGKTDLRAAFDEHDLCGFAVAAQTSCGGSATCYTANNNCFHRYRSVRKKGSKELAVALVCFEIHVGRLGAETVEKPRAIGFFCMCNFQMQTYKQC